MGEKQNQPFHLLFNASLKVDFQGSRERVGLQPGELVAAAGAAKENRPRVAREPAAAAGENRRTPDQARPIFLAAAGGESPHAAAVWGHAAKDCSVIGGAMANRHSL